MPEKSGVNDIGQVTHLCTVDSGFIFAPYQRDRRLNRMKGCQESLSLISGRCHHSPSTPRLRVHLKHNVQFVK